ncbi:tetratricopeptide repeat protein [Oricola sp.]|uniref:tetratricopeptide repeat protein n=1 Tax=Oricola sp. TaxID=1979950 RepID=UPI003BAA0DBF
MLIHQPVLADGGGGGSSDAIKCNSGWVWDKKQRKCVRQSSENVEDGDLLDSAIAFANGGRYDDAISALHLIGDTSDPEVWNYLGFATRKSGDLKGGLAYYRKALEVDPDYTLARAYMGEAFLTAGDRPAAVAQLREIERRDGRQGRAYTYLASALENQRQY